MKKPRGLYSPRWLAYGLFALAAGLAANSVLGPLLLDVIHYHYSESSINQGIGPDVVAHLGAAPVAVAAGVLVLRRHRARPVLAFIPATFAAYMAPQYVIGPEYLEMPGPSAGRTGAYHRGCRADLLCRRGCQVAAFPYRPALCQWPRGR